MGKIESANTNMAKAVIKAIDAYCDTIDAAVKENSAEAIAQSTRSIRNLARKMEEWFILQGFKI